MPIEAAPTPPAVFYVHDDRRKNRTDVLNNETILTFLLHDFIWIYNIKHDLTYWVVYVETLRVFYKVACRPLCRSVGQTKEGEERARSVGPAYGQVSNLDRWK